MEVQTETLQVVFDNGTTAYIQEVELLDPQVDNNFADKSFKNVIDAVEGISNSFTQAIEKAKPKKATIEFGIEVGVEAGKLTALIAKGQGKANFKVSLEWS